MTDNFLEVQGQKCKKYRPIAQPKKKSVQVTLIFGEIIPEAAAELPVPSSPIRTSVKTTSTYSPAKKEIILSADLPSVPFYMPKMLCRTPSPLRGTRSKFNNIRLNLYTPLQNTIPAEVALQNSSMNNKQITRRLHKSLNIGKILTKNKVGLKSHIRVKSNSIHIQFPSLSPKKNHGK